MRPIRYLYLRDEKKFPIAVLAYHLSELDEKNEMATYGLATFNPNVTEIQLIPPHPKSKETWPREKRRNVSFDRKFLREIAVGRLVTGHKTVKLPKTDCSDIHDIEWVIVTSLLLDRDVPKRTRRAVQDWLLEASQYVGIKDDYSGPEILTDLSGDLPTNETDFGGDDVMPHPDPSTLEKLMVADFDKAFPPAKKATV